MTARDPVAGRPGRSILWGALITLVLEAAVVATLAAIGLGFSFLMLWLAG